MSRDLGPCCRHTCRVAPVLRVVIYSEGGIVTPTDESDNMILSIAEVFSVFYHAEFSFSDVISGNHMTVVLFLYKNMYTFCLHKKIQTFRLSLFWENVSNLFVVKDIKKTGNFIKIINLRE